MKYNWLLIVALLLLIGGYTFSEYQKRPSIEVEATVEHYDCIAVIRVPLYNSSCFGYVDQGSIFYDNELSFMGYSVKYLNKRGKPISYRYAGSQEEVEITIDQYLARNDSICDLYNNRYYYCE